jgi:hypothetical protein
MTHILTKDHPFFFKLSVVKILLRNIIDAHTLNLGGTLSFHISSMFVLILGPFFIVKYADYYFPSSRPHLQIVGLNVDYG